MTPAAFVRPALQVAGLVCLLLIGGCYVPAPVTHVRLGVSAAGAFEFDGRPVAAALLQDAIATRRRGRPGLIVEIDASPEANVGVVREAVAAITRAHARVAFAGLGTVE